MPGIEADRASGEAGARRCRAWRDDRRVVGAVQDRVCVGGDAVQAMSGTSRGIDANRAGLGDGRARRRGSAGARVIAAVAGAPVAEVVRSEAS